jgi:hypothetical protein
MWTMKRTDIGGEVLKDDWVIIWDGREVGRIFFNDFHTKTPTLGCGPPGSSLQKAGG